MDIATRRQMTGENLLKWTFNARFNYQNSDFIQVFWHYYQNAEFYLTIQTLLAYSISELKFLWWIIYICTVDVQHFNFRQFFFLTPALPQLCPCSWLLYTKPFIAFISIFRLGSDSRPKCSFNVGSDSEWMPLLNCVNK